ncbi:hypothetical protein ACFC26_37165 [Kitasatospora purpeofusca]|uniref:hypothetical protein n=1 Tax=Kitasatospora purpeofusca TaxID=67352 RepID=UPI0035DFD1CD
MQVHRSAHARNFVVLPNALVQYRRLSYTARGLLADLLSRPDGWSEDAQRMADSSPQGRGAIRAALKELKEAGYYLVLKVRMPDGTIRSEAHVFDVPQRPGAEIIRPQAGEGAAERKSRPGAPRPASGESTSGDREALPVKDREQEPSLPQADGDRFDGQDRPAQRKGGRTATTDESVPEPPDEGTRVAMLALYRALRPEPRLRLGEAEALELAPLVARWLERGCGPAELAAALLPGLPARIHSPRAVVRDRLKRKLPVPPTQGIPAAQRLECNECRAPMPRPGLCPDCSGRPARVAQADSGDTAAGAARARSAMRPMAQSPAMARG